MTPIKPRKGWMGDILAVKIVPQSSGQLYRCFRLTIPKKVLIIGLCPVAKRNLTAMYIL